jgi:hypothetical protein
MVEAMKRKGRHEKKRKPCRKIPMWEDKSFCAMMHKALNPDINVFKNHRRIGKTTMLSAEMFGVSREEAERL